MTDFDPCLFGLLLAVTILLACGPAILLRVASDVQAWWNQHRRERMR